MSLSVPRVMVEVAFDTKPFEHPPIWTDLTDRALAIDTGRGRPRELTRVEAGEATIVLSNIDGALSAGNPDSPYVANLKPMKRVRVFAGAGNMIPNPDTTADEYGVWLPWVESIPSHLPEFWIGLTEGELPLLEPTVTYDATNQRNGHTSIKVVGAGGVGEAGAAVAGDLRLRSGDTHVLRFAWKLAAGTHTLNLYVENPADVSTRTLVGSFTRAHDGSWKEETLEWTSPVYLEDGVQFAFGTDSTDETLWIVEPQMEHGDTLSIFSAVPYVTWPIYSGFVERWLASQDGMNNLATIQAKDAFRPLALAPLRSSWYAEAIEASNPLHWYKLNDEPRANLAPMVDSAGDENGFYVGAVAAVDGPFYVQQIRGGTQFLSPDGSYGGHAQIPAAAIPTGPNWTMEFWFSTYNSSGDEEFFFGHSGADSGIQVVADIDGVGVVYFHWNAALSLLRTWRIDIDGSETWANDKQWHHLVIRQDGDNGTVFADGVLQTDIADLDWVGLEELDQIIYFLGRFVNVVTHTAMAHVVFYDRTITDAEAIEHYNLGAQPRTGDYADERIESILALIDWPAEDMALTVGDDQLQPQTLGESILLQIQRAAEADLGVVYASRSGVIQNASRRASVIGGAPWADALELSDDPAIDSNLKIATPVFSYDDGVINAVTRAKVGGHVVTLADEPSKEDYGERRIEQTDLILLNQADVEYQAQYLIHRYKDPDVRLDMVVVKPNADYETANAILSRELFDPVILSAKPPGFTTRVEFPTLLGRVAHHITRQSWRAELFLAPMDPTPYLTLDDPVLGSLDDNYLGY